MLQLAVIRSWGTGLGVCALLGACGGLDEGLLTRDDGVAAAGGRTMDGSVEVGPDGHDGTPMMDAMVADCVPRVEVCNASDDDCDGRVDEEASDTCAFDNATGMCLGGGTCVFIECLPGFLNCNGLRRDGCETPEDDDNCGACGLACGDDAGASIDAGVDAGVDAGPMCTVGTEVCNDLDDDCDGDTDEGLLGTLNHCGSCGDNCSYPNATALCSSGSCMPGACDQGFEDCDGDPDNGCEPTPCPAVIQACLDLQPSGFDTTCDACLCDRCLAEVQACEGNADATWAQQCAAVIDCYNMNPCENCGGTSTPDCTDCYADGTCTDVANTAAAGGSCSTDPPTNACSAASLQGACRTDQCLAECS